MPIVDPIPKATWRQDRQRQLAKQLWPDEPPTWLSDNFAKRVEKVWKKQILPGLYVASCRQGINARNFAHHGREILEELYELLAERGLLGVLLRIWEEAEHDLEQGCLYIPSTWKDDD